MCGAPLHRPQPPQRRSSSFLSSAASTSSRGRYVEGSLNIGHHFCVKNSTAGLDIVGWRTSSIRRNSELPKWEKSISEKYPHVVYEECTEGSTSEICSHENDDMLEEKLVVGLSRLSWEKVDVSFHSSKQRFAAHSIIQVKDPFMHSEGADVIQHIIDHLLI